MSEALLIPGLKTVLCITANGSSESVTTYQAATTVSKVKTW